MSELITALKTTLAQRPLAVRPEWEARPAAVLVPLYAVDGVWHLLLTRRTQHVASHKGQVAFPGGRVDPQDQDLTETALRETEEEIGLNRRRVTVIGQLDDLLTVTQYRITPVVGVIPWPEAFTPSAAEIDAIFGVPLHWLADPGNLTVRYREAVVPGPPIAVYHFHYGEYDIWGATARIIRNLLEVVAPLL